LIIVILLSCPPLFSFLSWSSSSGQLIGAAVTVWAGGPFVAWIVQPYADQLDGEAGLVEGGRIIGYAERLLIYVFVLADAPAAIGFLVTAKSLFRFGEVTGDQQRKHAEYVHHRDAGELRLRRHHCLPHSMAGSDHDGLNACRYRPHVSTPGRLTPTDNIDPKSIEVREQCSGGWIESRCG